MIVLGILGPIESRPHGHPRVAAQLGRADLGVGDRRTDRRRADRDPAADDQADPLDAAAPAVRARAEGAAAEVQGRQAAHERGGHEVLPGAQGEPGRFVPPDPAADPDLHLALLRAPRLREGGLPALPVVGARFSQRPRAGYHPARQRALVRLAAARDLRHQSAPVAPALDDRRAVEGPAVRAARAPLHLHPVHHQLPGRSDDLLGHDEPLDGGAGPRHAKALSAARARAPKKSSRTPAKEPSRTQPAAKAKPARAVVPEKTPPATSDGPAQPRPVRRRKKKGPRTRR